MAEKLLPIMVRLLGKRCVVVGGGEVALQKVHQLLECDAKVVVVSTKLCLGLQRLVEAGKICWLPQGYDPSVLNGSTLVFACTDDPDINRRVFDDCQGKGLWCNVVDTPPLCHFFMPSIMRRGELVIAVSTSGKSPAFARQLRLFLEDIISDEFGTLVAILGEMKEEMRKKLATIEARRAFMERVFNSDVWERLRERDLEGIRRCLKDCLEETVIQETMKTETGAVGERKKGSEGNNVSPSRRDKS